MRKSFSELRDGTVETRDAMFTLGLITHTRFVLDLEPVLSPDNYAA